MRAVMVMVLALLMSGLCVAQAPPKNIFLLAGQSNMVGEAGVVNQTWDKVVPPESEPNKSILKFTVNFTWQEASEPLHYGYYCTSTCGVGPGIPFAASLLRFRPSIESIGLVPSAIGGSSLADWKRGSLYYTNLVNKARAATGSGGVIRALLWFQGETDSRNELQALTYGQRFSEFVTDVRADLFSPNLPIIQVALASGGKFISNVRAAQLGLQLPNLHCVDANGSELEPDGLHLTTKSQVVLGGKLALAFASLE